MSEFTGKAMDRQETHHTSWAWKNPPAVIRAEVILRNQQLADRLMMRWMEAKQLRRAKLRLERKLKRESEHKTATKDSRVMSRMRRVSAEGKKIKVLQMPAIQRESSEGATA